jgi:hypothetical protein
MCAWNGVPSYDPDMLYVRTAQPFPFNRDTQGVTGAWEARSSVLQHTSDPLSRMFHAVFMTSGMNLNDSLTPWDEHRIRIPMSCIPIRPFSTWIMGAAVIGQDGLGVTMYKGGPAFRGQAAVGGLKTTQWSYYHQSTVLKRKAYAIVDTACCQEYVGRKNARFIDTSRYLGQGGAKYHLSEAAKFPLINQANESIFVIPAPYAQAFDELHMQRDFDIIGQFDYDHYDGIVSNDSFEIQAERAKPHYAEYLLMNFFFGFYQLRHTVPSQTQYHPFIFANQETVQLNTVVSLASQLIPGPGALELCRTVGWDMWGDKAAYTQCRNDHTVDGIGLRGLDPHTTIQL